MQDDATQQGHWTNQMQVKRCPEKYDSINNARQSESPEKSSEVSAVSAAIWSETNEVFVTIERKEKISCLVPMINVLNNLCQEIFSFSQSTRNDCYIYNFETKVTLNLTSIHYFSPWILLAPKQFSCPLSMQGLGKPSNSLPLIYEKGLKRLTRDVTACIIKMPLNISADFL